MNKKELNQLVLEDLERSGLTKADVTKMKATAFDEDEAEGVLDSGFCTYGYAFPYFDSAGKVTNYFRFKFLGELLDKNKKQVKYSQVKGTGSHLYFPPCIKWKKILKDPSIKLTFTEGEKKAYTACKAGILTIGLGGVYAFQSKKQGKALIDDFKEIVLEGREVDICYDNDLQSNADVLKAMKSFAVVLSEKGAKPYNKKLPFDPYQKIGMDDYLLEHSVKQYEELERESFENIDAVNQLDSEVAYIRSVGKFYIFDSDLFVTSNALKNDVFSHHTIFGEEGKKVSIAELWLKNKNRREHQRLTYKPAQPKVTEGNEYNLWEGWGRSPTKGSIKPFKDAVRKIFGNDKDLIQWLMDWIAYPIQYPGTKMLSAVLLQSVYQGTGKSSLGLCVGAMYGSNFQVINDKQLHATHNEWAINNQFILGDEVSGKDKRSDSDFIKNLVTQECIWINKKYMPTYSLVDCMNYFLTSNHVDAWYLEPDDRRSFVYSIEREDGLTLQEGIKLEKFRKGKGTAALLHYFIYEHKISKGFDHRARPPMTQAKADLIDHSLTDVERWVENLRVNAEFVLAIDGAAIDRDLYTTGQMVALYERAYPKTRVSGTAMGKAINKVLPDAKCYVVATQSGTKKLRAMRNFEKWKRSSPTQMRDHYDKSKIALFEARKKKHKG